MTKNGTKDARIQNRDEAANRRYFIDLQCHARVITLLLMAGLTVFLSWKEQYFYALCSACLSLAAATSDRLKRSGWADRDFKVSGTLSEGGTARGLKPRWPAAAV